MAGDRGANAISASDSVLSRVARGEEAAVEECLRRYGGIVWSMALRLLGNRAEAEDAVQDVFIDLWKSASRYEPSIASEATFVAMVARRRLIDRRRRLTRQPVTEEILPDAPPPEAIVMEPTLPGLSRRAKEALAQLRPEQRSVIEMSVFLGYSQDEIATRTGMPLGTVKTHARRGLIKLRELLSGAAAMPAPDGRSA